MINTIDQFGRNAGRVWETLNIHGPLTESQLMETTSLRPYEFYVAIGWLARENKICRDGALYMLAETNLTFEIGENAGKIWTILNNEKKVDIPYIIKLTQMNRKDTCAALGWLARENKIQLNAGG